MPDNMHRADYAAETQRPGKFQGECAYVPYFWNIFLDGGADADDGTILTFDVTENDRAMFPELARRTKVHLREREDGFVIEV